MKEFILFLKTVAVRICEYVFSWAQGSSNWFVEAPMTNSEVLDTIGKLMIGKDFQFYQQFPSKCTVVAQYENTTLVYFLKDFLDKIPDDDELFLNTATNLAYGRCFQFLCLDINKYRTKGERSIRINLRAVPLTHLKQRLGGFAYEAV